MPHLQFEFNFVLQDDDKRAFAEDVKETFSRVMDTGSDHIAVTLRSYDTYALALGRATSAEDGIAFVNADIRSGRSSDQKRQLCLGFMHAIHARWEVPMQNMYVILTEHPGEHFQLDDRVLAGWSEGEDPLA